MKVVFLLLTIIVGVALAVPASESENTEGSERQARNYGGWGGGWGGGRSWGGGYGGYGGGNRGWGGGYGGYGGYGGNRGWGGGYGGYGGGYGRGWGR